MKRTLTDEEIETLVCRVEWTRDNGGIRRRLRAILAYINPRGRTVEDHKALFKSLKRAKLRETT